METSCSVSKKIRLCEAIFCFCFQGPAPAASPRGTHRLRENRFFRQKQVFLKGHEKQKNIPKLPFSHKERIGRAEGGPSSLQLCANKKHGKTREKQNNENDTHNTRKKTMETLFLSRRSSNQEELQRHILHLSRSVFLLRKFFPKKRELGTYIKKKPTQNKTNNKQNTHRTKQIIRSGGFCWLLLAFAGFCFAFALLLLGFCWLSVAFGGLWWLSVGFR